MDEKEVVLKTGKEDNRKVASVQWRQSILMQGKAEMNRRWDKGFRVSCWCIHPVSGWEKVIQRLSPVYPLVRGYWHLFADGYTGEHPVMRNLVQFLQWRAIHALFGLCPPQADFCLRRNNGWTIPFFEITYSILDCGAEYAPQGTEKWGISKDIRILISFFRREVRNKRCDHRATHQYLLL